MLEVDGKIYGFSGCQPSAFHVPSAVLPASSFHAVAEVLCYMLEVEASKPEGRQTAWRAVAFIIQSSQRSGVGTVLPSIEIESQGSDVWTC